MTRMKSDLGVVGHVTCPVLFARLYRGGGRRKEKTMLKQGRVKALGAMSGTSLDGVDAAVIETDGVEIFDFGDSHYRPTPMRSAPV